MSGNCKKDVPACPSGEHNKPIQKCLCEVQPIPVKYGPTYWDARIKFNEKCPLHGKNCGTSA